MFRGLVVAALVGAAGVLAGCSSKPKPEPETPLAVKMQEKDVPPEVMNAFSSSYPGATVSDVRKEVFSDGSVRYAFRFRSIQGSEREARISSAGRLMPQ